jgi:signal transduction histidine kinase
MNFRGLAVRLTLLIAAGSAAVLAMVAFYNYRYARGIVSHNVEESARHLADATVERVQTVLRSTEKIPQSLASALENATYSREELLAMIRATVERNPEIYGATVAFEPYAFEPRSKYFAPYYYRSRGEIRFRALGSESYDYFRMDWYQIPRETGHPSWTEPYFDEGGGEIVMASYALPFYRSAGREWRLAGVVDVDVSLESLKSVVSGVRILQTGRAFLITRNGTFLAHPAASLVMNETLFSFAESENRPELRAIGRKMLNGESGFVPLRCLMSDEACWLDYAPVPANGWSLGVLFPDAELRADVARLNRSVVARASAGAVVLLLLVVAVARTVTGPLVALARASDAIAGGNLDGPLPRVDRSDEVGRLAVAFGRMQRDLKRTIEDLRETSAARERAAAELAEYSRTLEQKVDERTRDLSEKNEELERTLTTLRETQKQLVLQEKLASLGALTAGIAHEIKNPLNFVNNFAALSKDVVSELRCELEAQKHRLDERSRALVEECLTDLQQNVAKISEHGRRADAIVRDMLAHARSGSGTRRQTDLNALVAEYANLAYHGLRAQDASFNVKLETAFDPRAGSIAVVPEDLGRVVLNVVNNACYAVDEKRKQLGDGFIPTVRVETRDAAGRVEIRVRDNGNGVPESVREKVFQPFFTTKPAGAGTGLGLSISYDIVVQDHGGEFRVESEAGEYAEFIVVLPRGTG